MPLSASHHYNLLRWNITPAKIFLKIDDDTLRSWRIFLKKDRQIPLQGYNNILFIIHKNISTVHLVYLLFHQRYLKGIIL